MKYLILVSFLLSFFASSQTTHCPLNHTRYFVPGVGYSCVLSVPQNNQDCIFCTPPFVNHQTQLNSQFNFPFGWHRPHMPWWAAQGGMMYPNFYFPGSWANHGIYGPHYPGHGNVQALKPNIYVESSLEKQKFKMIFKQKEKSTLIATTPFMDNQQRFWEGFIKKNSFEVADVNYEYLFYDIRFDHENLQFDHGVCLGKESLIEHMKDELINLKFSDQALKDFEEHWAVKIPSYPYYCIYPQYNKQLDKIIPIDVLEVEANWTRVLFVVTVHQNIVNSKTSIPSKPRRDPIVLRPDLTNNRKAVFQEWGVAFLDHSFFRP